MKTIEDALRDLVSDIYRDGADNYYQGNYETSIKELSRSIENIIDLKIKDAFFEYQKDRARQ